jgi:hypothetical protein
MSGADVDGAAGPVAFGAVGTAEGSGGGAVLGAAGTTVGAALTGGAGAAVSYGLTTPCGLGLGAAPGGTRALPGAGNGAAALVAMAGGGPAVALEGGVAACALATSGTVAVARSAVLVAPGGGTSGPGPQVAARTTMATATTAIPPSSSAAFVRPSMAFAGVTSRGRSDDGSALDRTDVAAGVSVAQGLPGSSGARGGSSLFASVISSRVASSLPVASRGASAAAFSAAAFSAAAFSSAWRASHASRKGRVSILCAWYVTGGTARGAASAITTLAGAASRAIASAGGTVVGGT